MFHPSSVPPLRTATLALTILLAAAAPPLHAGAEYMVQDLGQRVQLTPVNFEELPYATLNGVAYFFRDDGIHGLELWRSDGTPAGTHLLRDVCPGLCGSEGFYSALALATVGERVFFTGNDGVSGTELWVTDGTAPGTHRVADLRPGPHSSDPDVLTAVGDSLYFVADDGVHGRDLWLSDGTASGTRRAFPFTSTPLIPEIGEIEPGLGQLFVRTQGGSLWRTDGTAAGTRHLVDGVGFPSVSWLNSNSFRTLPDGVLVFQECPGVAWSDCELWRSDGTVAGTQLVADLVPGPDYSSNPQSFVRMGSEIWFRARDPDPFSSRYLLYRTDGTPAGTAPLPLPAGVSATFEWGDGGVLGGRLFFIGSDAATGWELWVTDGSTTQQVADLNPGPESSLEMQATLDRPSLAAVGGVVVFLADDGVDGLQLWSSDGTVAGTQPLTDFGGLTPEDGFGYEQLLAPLPVAGGRVLLTVRRPGQGIQVWGSDGTVAGTGQLAAVDEQTSAFVHGTRSFYTDSPTRCTAPLGRGLVFDALDDPNAMAGHLYFSDGVPGTATPLFQIQDPLSAYPTECASNGDEVLAVGGPGTAPGLWRTRGTSDDTELLSIFDENSWGITLPLFQRFDGAQYLGWGESVLRVEPGIDPALIQELPTDIWYGRFAALPDALFIGGSDGLERSDGETPFEPLIPVPPSPDWIQADDLTPSGSRLYFTLDTPAEGPELWSSEGKPLSTGPVVVLRPGPEGAIERREIEDIWAWKPPDSRIASLGGGRVVFAADDGQSGNELWTSDGTAAGTVLIADLVPGPDGSWPRHLSSLGSAVIFAADDGVHGLELWRTDGTAAGTGLLLDIVPGVDSSVPQDLTVQGGVLYFSAWTPDAGREAWRSDGTAAGTFRLTDAAPGPLSSSPSRFTRVGDRLFFVADDNLHGFELWALADNGGVALFLDGFETGDASRWSAAAP